MSYRFTTFNNYVPFDVYIQYLSRTDMKRIINEIYAEARGYQHKNLTLDANNAATLKTLLLLIDYCFKSTPFSSKQQIEGKLLFNHRRTGSQPSSVLANQIC